MKSPTVDRVERKKLDYGDYSCVFNDGEVSRTFFERKGFSDLFQTMGYGYPRFKKEMARAKDNGDRLILIIEGSVKEVLKGYKYSTLKGYSIVKKLFTLWIRFGLLPVFCVDRVEMVQFILETYNAEGREKLLKEKGR